MNEDLKRYFPNLSAEKPFACSECKKEETIVYTVVENGTQTHTVLCQDCPELQRRLHGLSKEEIEAKENHAHKLCCGCCGTTLDAIRTGHLLGCPECYEVFDEVIKQELLRKGAIPSRFSETKPHSIMHIGRSPGSGPALSPSMRLLALNEALSETLEKEDYEQAALLRDQIKKITEEQHEEK